MLRGGLAELLALLELEPVERNLFLGRSPPGRSGRVYGGQVAAQAPVAAERTLSGAAAQWWPRRCRSR